MGSGRGSGFFTHCRCCHTHPGGHLTNLAPGWNFAGLGITETHCWSLWLQTCGTLHANFGGFSNFTGPGFLTLAGPRITETHCLSCVLH